MEEIERMLIKQASKILDLSTEPELEIELKKIESLITIYDTLKKIEKLI